jgi:hypothetical protein
MYLLNRILVSLIFSFFVGASYSQSLHGRLTDNKNNPVAYAAIYDETTYAGTTSNADGYYDLKLESGKHSLVFKALGYYLERREISTFDKPVTINITFTEQAYELEEVIVKPGKEDPAYGIMRKVIGLAPYHLNQVKEYTADVYLRGTIHIIKIPKIVANHVEVDGKKIQLKDGDVFLEESVNQIHFDAPDKFEQKVISFHSTFPENDNQVNPMEIIRSSIYQPKNDQTISPLAPDAFNYYKFRYEGFFAEGKNTIFKIKVTPKQNSQQLLNGYLYVVDQLWCIHSVDAYQQVFFGTISFKALYSPIKSDAWLPISYQFDIDAAMAGMKANFKYASSIKFQQVALNENLIGKSSDIGGPKPVKATIPQTKSEQKKQKNLAEIDTLLAKEKLSNRDMVKLATLMSKEAPGDTAKTKSLEIKDETNKVTIEKDALKKDTSYWDTIRPIPLTGVESKIQSSKDTVILAQKDSKVHKVSASKKKRRKQIKIVQFILRGSGFWALDSTLRVNYNGVLNLNNIDFNTVDGLVFRQSFNLIQKIDSAHSLKIDPGIAYAFSRNRLMWWTDFNYAYAPMRLGNIHLHIGSESADYNGESGINTSLNSIASLFFRRNYLKLYQQNLMFLSNKLDIVNGLTFTATIGYKTAQPLVNNSDFSFFYNNTREYTPNIPDSNANTVARNVYNEEAYWEAKLEYTPRYFYRIVNGRKKYQYSKWPTFFVYNKMAIPGIVNSSADYDLLEAGATQKIEWGLMHAFSWELKGGHFLNSNKIYLMNDKFMNNQNLPVLIGNLTDAFRLVPYYENSTTESYGEAHIQYSTPYLAIKYLPFLSKKIWCENLHLNYYTSNVQKNYWEVGYSISQIYFVGTIGVFAGFSGTTYQSWGIQASFRFR